MFESTVRFLIIIIFLSSIILFVSLIKNTEDTQNSNDLNTPFPKFSLTLLSKDQKVTNDDLDELFLLKLEFYQNHILQKVL